MGIHPDSYRVVVQATLPSDEVNAGENDAKSSVDRIARNCLDRIDGGRLFCSGRGAGRDSRARGLTARLGASTN